jgi:hypothetical protein
LEPDNQSFKDMVQAEKSLCYLQPGYLLRHKFGCLPEPARDLPGDAASRDF